MRSHQHPAESLISLLQVLQQAPGGRERFRLTQGHVWHGLQALLQMSHAAALAAILSGAPALLNVMLAAATSAEQRSYLAVACVHEVFTTLRSQVKSQSRLSMDDSPSTHVCKFCMTMIWSTLFWHTRR